MSMSKTDILKKHLKEESKKGAIRSANLRISAENSLLRKGLFFLACCEDLPFKESKIIKRDIKKIMDKEKYVTKENLDYWTFISDFHLNMVVVFMTIRDHIGLDSIILLSKFGFNLESSDFFRIIAAGIPSNDKYINKYEKNYIKLILKQISLLKDLKKERVEVIPLNWVSSKIPNTIIPGRP